MRVSITSSQLDKANVRANVSDHVMSSRGVSLHSSGSLLMEGEVLDFLSHHSHPGHASAGSIGNPVLSRDQADLVLDHLALPDLSDDTMMHGARIGLEDGKPVARVAWVQPAVVDKMNDLPGGTTKERVGKLRAWAAAQEGDRNTTTIQPASGQYISLGNGILPGKGRQSVLLNGRPSNVPFSRAPASRSDEVEPILSSLNSTMAVCVAALFPDMVTWCVADGAEDDQHRWTQVCQYPRPTSGGLTFPSQQVVVRGHFSNDRSDASAADLHVDKMDGGAQFGGTILFLGGNELHPAQWRKFAIFESAKGGRGVSIPVLTGDCLCALICQYQHHLHGTVFESVEEGVVMASSTEEDFPSRSVEGLHVVSYNLRMIEGFVARIAQESAERQAEIASNELDERLRARASTWLGRRIGTCPLHDRGFEIVRHFMKFDQAIKDRIRGSETEKIFNGVRKGELVSDGRRLQTVGEQEWKAEVGPKLTAKFRELGYLSSSQGEKTLEVLCGLRSLPRLSKRKLHQPRHADSAARNSLRDRPTEDVPLAFLLALQDETKLHCWPFDTDEKEIANLQEGDLIIFRGDLGHAGDEGDEENWRLHGYLDSPVILRPVDDDGKQLTFPF